MIPYLVVFAFSSAFIALAGSTLRMPPVVRLGVGMCGALIVSVLAGVRDLTGPVAGTDVTVYGNPVFLSISMVPTWEAAVDVGESYGFHGEVGYIWLNYAVSRLTSDPHVFFGLVALIGSSLVVLVILMFREHGSPVLMWLTYLCISYVDGFNLLRQGIAMSIVLLAVALLLKRHVGWGLATGFSALLFHNSAIVFVPMALAIWYLTSRRRRIGVAVLLIIAIGLVVMLTAATWLDAAGGVLSDTKYADYIGESARRGSAIGMENLYRALPLALGWGVVWATRQRRGSGDTAVETQDIAEGSVRRGPMRQTMIVPTAVATAPAVARAKPFRMTLIVIMTFLTVETVLLPMREISYPLYRIPLYFGYLRILGYAAIVAHAGRYRRIVAVGAYAFVVLYFALLVIGRDGLEFSSVILDQWLQPR